MFRFFTSILLSPCKTGPRKCAVPIGSRRRFRPTFDLLETREVPSAALVRDINSGGHGSAPTDLVSMNGKLFFTADDGIHGRELWTSDGTPGGTHLVRDIDAGTIGSEPLYLTVVTNNLLYFSADDGLRGRELWVSNGTSLGTHLVRDIYAGPSDSNPSELIAFKGTLFFAANDGLHGRELWRSNGTFDGTTMVRDINLGPASSAPAYLTTAIVAGRLTANGPIVQTLRLFFAANDGLHGAELWSTDGSSARLARDIRPGPLGSNPFNLTAVRNPFLGLPNGALFFGANDGFLGNELWLSNGLALTKLVRDINPGSASSLIASPTTLMANVNGRLFFAADNGFNGRELWQSNGSFIGTRLLKDINPGPGSSNPTAQQQPLPQFRNLIINGNVLLFGANDGVFGGELWRTDGTSAGTLRVLDINVGSSSGLADNQLIGAVLNNQAYFAASNGAAAFNIEPWRSNGTTSGTRLVQDINPGAAASSPSDFAVVNGVLFFAADNGLFGRELWRLPV